jgi:hypothetical protein
MRLASDPVFRLIENLRRRVKHALAGNAKLKPTLELMGCSGDWAMSRLRLQFWPGMTVENNGPVKWEVDHILPLDSFDKTDSSWQSKAFHWTNLQPLWKDDNSAKRARLDWTPDESKHELPEWWTDRGTF